MTRHRTEAGELHAALNHLQNARKAMDRAGHSLRYLNAVIAHVRGLYDEASADEKANADN